MANTFELTPTLASKLGSLVVHVEEWHSPDGHYFDRIAIEGVLSDPEVKEWVSQMRGLGLLPVMRVEAPSDE